MWTPIKFLSTLYKFLKLDIYFTDAPSRFFFYFNFSGPSNFYFILFFNFSGPGGWDWGFSDPPLHVICTRIICKVVVVFIFSFGTLVLFSFYKITTATITAQEKFLLLHEMSLRRYLFHIDKNSSTIVVTLSCD